MISHIDVTDHSIEAIAPSVLDDAPPLDPAEPDRIFRVPEALRRDLASATWCVFEWTSYEMRFPNADRLKVGSEWVSPTFKDVAGRFVISFENQLGIASITPYNGDIALEPPFTVEVLARKFATPQQSVDFLNATITDIFARSSSLPFNAIASTERRVREHHRPPDLLFLFHFFRRQSETLIRALQAILGRPHQVLTDDGVMVRLHEVRSLEQGSIMRLLTDGRGSSAARPVAAGASVLQRLQPERVFQRLPEETYDTPENRFVVLAARRMLLDLERLLRSPWFGKLQLDERDRRPFVRSKEQLGLLTTDARFSALPHMQVYPSQSRVLQRKDGYRELAQLWNLFQRASYPIFEDVQNAIDLRDIAALYEYWVWFELIEMITVSTGETPAISIPKDELGAPTHGQHARFGSVGTLHYNKTYSKGRQVFSPVNLRPDYVWERADGRLIVMDAKFRLDKLSELIASGDDDVPAVSARAKDADFHKMHTYRDAIDGVTAAIVLYPGSERGFWSVDGTSTGELDIRDVIEGDLHGVGAIPLLPTMAKVPGGQSE